ncbi:hypothetical protein QJS10_CPB18g00271 [Acorus calamus]|uniref:Uncharacterized protein n=1 Tax=Acorus calamus TaxID=4465 RepID=A0AAV9CNI6_ACOCL|nr:hypothetical protein QJS10_CPB18g00271 [Acorus calamus]
MATTTTNNNHALGVPSIIREALNLPQKNPKLSLSIVLLVFLTDYPLSLSHHLLMSPRLITLVDNDSDYNLTDPPSTNTGLIISIESLFFIALSVLSLFTMSVTVHASSATYTNKHVTLHDSIRSPLLKWKNPFVTLGYVFLITVAYALLMSVILGSLMLFSSGSPFFVILITCVGLFLTVFYIHFSVVWMLGLTVSIVEDECYGMDALVRANKVIEGRKSDGFLLMVMLLLLYVPVTGLGYVNLVDDDLGQVGRVVGGVVVVVLMCLVKLFGFVGFVVFYYECKKGHGEKVEMESLGYAVVPNSALDDVDADLP